MTPNRWYKTYRMEWIAETLRVFGFINRKHIQRKFGLSIPQASFDLKEFQRLYPKSIEYNLQAKQFTRKG